MTKASFFWRKAVRQPGRWSKREQRAIASFPLDVFQPSLDQNVKDITDQLGRNMDFVSRVLIVGGRRAALFFFHTLVDLKQLNEQVILPLEERWEDGLTDQGPLVTEEETEKFPLDIMGKRILAGSLLERVDTWPRAVRELLAGKVLLLVDGETAGLLIGVNRVSKRNISEPDTEHSVIGPRESFVEDRDTNLALVRKWLKDPFLTVESVHVARRGNSEAAVLYVADIANPEVVQEVKRRLSLIDADVVYGHMYLQEMIQDNAWSLFPQMRATERPDVVSSYLLEGCVAILDGSSTYALIVPMSFFQLLSTVDDYYSPWQYATLIRIVRVMAIILSIAIPGLYLSLVAYNPELIPTRLVISMEAARARVAMPMLLEILVMEVMIEILREAGIKLPRPVGQAVSIVGGLVIGEAAVNANLVSPVTVVIVALTAISSFSAPVYQLGITYRILRFFLLFASSVLGLYGFMLGVFVIHAHLCKLVSFGVPYLAPLSPLRLTDWKDTMVRFPFRKLTNRATFLKPLAMKALTPLPMKLSRNAGKDANVRQHYRSQNSSGRGESDENN